MDSYFCTNADCKKLLTDFELNRQTFNKSGTLKGSKFKFCVRCRHDQRLIEKLRCVQCAEVFNPVKITEEHASQVGTIFKVFCDNCSHENNKRRSLEQYYQLTKDPKYSEKRNKVSKIKRLQKQGRLPKDMEIVV